MIYFFYLTIACFILAVSLKCVSYLRLCILEISTQNMQVIRHRLIKQIFLRFTNCAKLGIHIHNTRAFVARYLQNYSLCGMHYGTFGSISLCLVMGGIALTITGVLKYQDIYYTYALTAILCSVLYFLFCSVINCERKKEQIINSMTDYLDNTLSHRISSIQSLKSNGAAAKKEEKEIPKEEAKHKDTTASKTDSTSEAAATSLPSSPSVSKKGETEDEIIFSVINDFLV